MNAPHRAPSTFTTAEFNKLVESGGFGRARVELRRGLILKMNAAHIPHGTIKENLAEAIKAGLRNAGLTWRAFQEVSVDFKDGFAPLPDIVVWDPMTAEKGPIPASAVKLIVEVSDSSLADDLGEKLEDYARAGLLEYWVADVKGRTIFRHTVPTAAGYANREAIPFGAKITSLAYPTLEVDTSDLAS